MMENVKAVGMLVLVVVVSFFILPQYGCNLDKALEDGIAQAGKNAATEVVDRFPEITPQLKDAISGAVVAGLDHVITELKLKPQTPSGGLWETILSGIGVVLAYLIGHRSAWIRVVIDYLKGKPTLQPSNLTSKKDLKDSGAATEVPEKEKESRCDLEAVTNPVADPVWVDDALKRIPGRVNH
jgi:hypothetical protein